MRKVCELGRFILSKSGADKKEFLSAVYKKGTQAKKHRLDAAQYGRSMVEMLGVLAIIGVLSVGGIAGYSKAMLKYKINNSLDTLSQLIASIVEFRTSNSVRIGILDNNSDLKKIGIDCDLNNSNQCIFALGTYSLDIRGVLGILTLNINAGANSKDFCTAFFNSKI